MVGKRNPLLFCRVVNGNRSQAEKILGLLVHTPEIVEHIQAKNQTTISLKRFLGPARKEGFSVKLAVTRIHTGSRGEVGRCEEAAASRTRARKKTRSGAARIVFVRNGGTQSYLDYTRLG